jgi:hypothetical protein
MNSLAAIGKNIAWPLLVAVKSMGNTIARSLMVANQSIRMHQLYMSYYSLQNVNLR